MERINRFIDEHRIISSIVLLPVFVFGFSIMAIAARIEQATMKLKGYDWDSGGWEYVDRETGEVANGWI